MDAKWYAVYTKSRWEKKVADQFTKAGIENYCPLNRVTRQWSDRKKVVEEPLFTSYVFVRITERQMTAVRLIHGVVNFVYWLGRPAVIPPAEITTIQEFLVSYLDVKLEAIPLNVRDTVRVLSGPFTEMEGNIISMKKKSVRVLLPSLRFFMTAEIEIENLARV